MRILLFLILLVISTKSFSQFTLTDFAKAEMKYWKLRGRLTGDENNRDKYNGFMNVGEGQGKSIVFDIRYPLYKRNFWQYRDICDPGGNSDCGCFTQIINNVQTANTSIPIIDPRDGNELKGIMEQGDNPLIVLGEYLAVLATEWQLLHRESYSTLQTEKEIYYALKAVERWDYAGELGHGVTSEKNGFLKRGDANQYTALNDFGKDYDLVLSHSGCGDNCKECFSNTTLKYNSDMSQDEVVGILFGFAFIKKMIPSYVTYNGENLLDMTKEHTANIITYIKEENGFEFWTIVQPKDNAPFKKVCRGNFPFLSSWPIAAIGQYITGYSFQNMYSINFGYPIWEAGKNFYAGNNWYEMTTFQGIPSNIQYELGFNAYEPISRPGSHDNGIFKYGHGRAYTVNQFLRTLCASFTAPRPAFFDASGRFTINTIAQTYKREMYDLAGAVLYGYTPVMNFSWWYNEFNQAPCNCACFQSIQSGSYNGCDIYQNTNGIGGSDSLGRWNTPNRWSGHKVEAKVFQQGNMEEYNGLDYMLAYNLYRYKYFSGGYSNRVRAVCDNKTYPYLSEPNPYDNNNVYLLGSSQYPIEAKAVFSIEGKNVTITPNGSVFFSAGSSIRLNPGFNIKPGAVFKAKIKDYNCEPDFISLPNSSYVGWKSTDSFQNTMFDYSIDTTIEIQDVDDSLSNLYPPPSYDSNMLIINTINDTTYYIMNPDYIYLPDTIIYAPQNNNKQIIQLITNNSITLFPNPTSDKATVSYHLYTEENVELYVTNQWGARVSNVVNESVQKLPPGKQQHNLSTYHLASGIYFCHIIINGHKTVKKFSVVR